ncbi:MAG TPA: SpaA isopeptide-forming pilin-related protein, partial [Thermomicrobiales bacterium]|nr:SpaA isopeptide-forming pilin-related protein [Thermomicrobiales bacterium]
NAALPGACFALLQGNATIASRCDGDDGASDGAVNFIRIGVGTFTLRETRRPSASYQPIADQQVRIDQNRTTRLTVKNELRPGRVLVRKTNQNGNPLQNACFDLQTDGQQPLCSDANGQIVFDNLAPGIYKLVETQAPPGFLPAAPVTNIVVNPGATTTVDVEDQLAPPPPNTGSIRVIKFSCPAGEAGEGTRFIDSSNPGGNQLTQTSGCAVSDASFRLTPANGGGQPIEFSTGADGIFQTTVPAGDYLLQETSPDLPGDQQEPVTVFVNQQTTVVVLNDVAPPAPAPAAVAIRKYTCAPGFQGTVFADFVAACLQDQNLTNNVVFRIDGPTSARRVTGDVGQQGLTQFPNLPPGNYTLTETAPSATQTTYAFCGLDAANPTSRIVGTGVMLQLTAGQAVTCTWFNVPDQVTPTTGAIVIHKLGCAATAYPPNFDWYGQCQPQGAGIRFALSVFDGKNFVPRGTGATNDDGLLSFTALPAGTYAIEEVGGVWCRAQSDSVDARGNIVVQTGQRANVWIFNCLGTRNPPNTGAGPLAGAPPSPLSNALLGLSLVWPLAGLAWLRFGRRAA